LDAAARDAAHSRVVVAEARVAAEDWIAERIGGATRRHRRYPLASRCLKKGAKPSGPTGKPFTTTA